MSIGNTHPLAAQPTPKLSVVICTHNRSTLLADSIASLACQETTHPFEVVVVDDGSTDNTQSIVSQAATDSRSPVRYAHQVAAGQNAARNRGIREAAGEIVLFFDDDEIAPEGYLQKLIRRMQDDPSVDGVGGPYVDNGTGLHTCDGCSLASADLKGTGLRRAPRLLGGNMALRASLFSEIGGFDETFAWSGRGNDDEWFFRARDRGKIFLQDPELWVWHRRDHLRLLPLCRQAFRQGLTVPMAVTMNGKRFRPKWVRIFRGLAHAARRGCAKGVWYAAKDIGCIVGYAKMVFTGRA